MDSRIKLFGLSADQVLMHKVIVYFIDPIPFLLLIEFCYLTRGPTNALRLGWQSFLVLLHDTTSQSLFLVVRALSL